MAPREMTETLIGDALSKGVELGAGAFDAEVVGGVERGTGIFDLEVVEVDRSFLIEPETQSISGL